MTNDKIKVINYLEPKKLLGKAIHIYTKQGGEFNFKVTHCGYNWLGGFDDESLEMQISIKDIDFILGG